MVVLELLVVVSELISQSCLYRHIFHTLFINYCPRSIISQHTFSLIYPGESSVCDQLPAQDVLRLSPRVDRHRPHVGVALDRAEEDDGRGVSRVHRDLPRHPRHGYRGGHDRGGAASYGMLCCRLCTGQYLHAKSIYYYWWRFVNKQ